MLCIYQVSMPSLVYTERIVDPGTENPTITCDCILKLIEFAFQNSIIAEDIAPSFLHFTIEALYFGLKLFHVIFPSQQLAPGICKKPLDGRRCICPPGQCLVAREQKNLKFQGLGFVEIARMRKIGK